MHSFSRCTALLEDVLQTLNALLDRPLLSDLVQRFVLFLDVVIIFVVDVDISTLYVCKTLKLTLKSLADVMSDLEWKTFVHNDIDLDVVLLTRVVCATLI